MYCRKCGTELPDESLFCSKCGTKILDYKAAETAKKEPKLIIGGIAFTVVILLVFALIIGKNAKKNDTVVATENEEYVVRESSEVETKANTEDTTEANDSITNKDSTNDDFPEITDGREIKVNFWNVYNVRYLYLEGSVIDIGTDAYVVGIDVTKSKYRPKIHKLSEKTPGLITGSSYLSDNNSIMLKNAYVDYYNEYLASLQPKIDEYYYYACEQFANEGNEKDYHKTDFYDYIPKQTVLHLNGKDYHILIESAQIEASDYVATNGANVPTYGKYNKCPKTVFIRCNAVIPENEYEEFNQVTGGLYEENFSADSTSAIDPEIYDKYIGYETTLSAKAGYSIEEYEEYLKHPEDYEITYYVEDVVEETEEVEETSQDENSTEISYSNLNGTYYDPTTFSVMKITFNGDGTGKVNFGNSRTDSATYTLEGNKVTMFLTNTTIDLTYDGEKLYDNSGSTYVKQ